MGKENNLYKMILKSINEPLGFYVLALLIIEAFIATVLIGSNLDNTQKFIGMIIGVFLFVIVVIIVTLCVWYKPKNLMFNQMGHLVDEGKAYYGTREKSMAKEDMVNMKKTNAGGVNGHV